MSPSLDSAAWKNELEGLKIDRLAASFQDYRSGLTQSRFQLPIPAGSPLLTNPKTIQKHEWAVRPAPVEGFGICRDGGANAVLLALQKESSDRDELFMRVTSRSESIIALEAVVEPTGEKVIE